MERAERGRLLQEIKRQNAGRESAEEEYNDL
jgi:hypothetical protein